MDYGKAVRVARALSGLQQKELAESAGLDASYVSLIEMGKRRPSARAVRSLSHALKIPSELLTLLAIEGEDMTLVEPEEVHGLAQSLAKLILPEVFDAGVAETAQPKPNPKES